MLTDADLTVTLDTGDVDNVATQAAINFSRNVHYLLTNLTTDSARLIARQNFDSNAFETWRLLRLKIALPDATRHVSLLNLTSILGKPLRTGMNNKSARHFPMPYWWPLC